MGDGGKVGSEEIILVHLNHAVFKNAKFREILWTTETQQMAAMCVKTEIPLEVHKKSDQLLVITSGIGIVYAGTYKSKPLHYGDAFLVPKNTPHRVENLGRDEDLPLRLYTLYFPPAHVYDKNGKELAEDEDEGEDENENDDSVDERNTKKPISVQLMTSIVGNARPKKRFWAFDSHSVSARSINGETSWTTVEKGSDLTIVVAKGTGILKVKIPQPGGGYEEFEGVSIMEGDGVLIRPGVKFALTNAERSLLEKASDPSKHALKILEIFSYEF